MVRWQGSDMRHVLAGALLVLTVSGCAHPPATPTAQAPAPAPPLPKDLFLGFGSCQVQVNEMNLDHRAVTAVLPDGIAPAGLADPVRDVVHLDIMACDDLNATALHGPVRLAFTEIPVYYSRSLAGRRDFLSFLAEAFVDSPDPGVLAALAKEGLPVQAAAITLTDQGGSVTAEGTAYQTELDARDTPVGSSSGLDRTRFIYGGNEPTGWVDIDGSAPGAFAATRVHARQGLLAALADGGEAAGEAFVGTAPQLFQFGHRTIQADSPVNVPENRTGLSLRSCDGWSALADVPSSEADPLLPPGFRSGTSVPALVTQAPTVSQLARLQAFSMTCDAYAPGLDLHGATLGWESVMLSAANGSEVHGADMLNSFVLGWYASPGLASLLNSNGWNVTAAEGSSSSNGLRLAGADGRTFVAAECSSPVQGVGLPIQDDRRFFLKGTQVSAIDLGPFYVYEQEQGMRTLASAGRLSTLMPAGTLGECQWMTGDLDVPLAAQPGTPGP